MKKKGLMVLGMGIWLCGFFIGCVGGDGAKDELSVIGEANPEFDFTESFAKLDTKITVNPPQCSDTTTASFKFKCTGGTLPCKFQCQLDGSGKWAKCKKAQTFTALSEGPHTLLVRAIDATGKKDKTPEQYSWTIGIDNDGDSYADYCDPVSVDCNDANSGIKPGATEICNGLDDDCDTQTDEGVTNSYYADADSDGYGNPSAVVQACTAPAGYVSDNTDCNDANASIYPSATEILCDGADNDCNSATLDDPVDGDGDGFGTCFDCDDTNNEVYPGASEICDGIDNQCPGDFGAGQIDEGCISAGGLHTCGLTSGGVAKCWGSNSYGQLGNGSYNNSNVPVGVFGLSSGVRAISAGEYHTCALLTTGGVKCWGYNGQGQLGDGTYNNSNVPVNVSGLSSGVKALSAGNDVSCALLTTGGVKGWGSNQYGQIGDGTSGVENYKTTPVNVISFEP